MTELSPAAERIVAALRYTETLEYAETRQIEDLGYLSTYHRMKYREGGTEPIISLPHVFGRDSYGRDAVSEANYRVLAERESDEDYPFVRLSYLNTDGLAIRLNLATDEDADMIETLADYGCLDDDLMLTIEREIEQETWDGWGRGELRRHLEDAFGEDLPESVTDDVLDDAWYDAMQALDIYPEHSCGECDWPGLGDRETHVFIGNLLGLDPLAVEQGLTSKDLAEMADAANPYGDPSLQHDGDLLTA